MPGAVLPEINIAWLLASKDVPLFIVMFPLTVIGVTRETVGTLVALSTIDKPGNTLVPVPPKLKLSLAPFPVEALPN